MAKIQSPNFSGIQDVTILNALRTIQQNIEALSAQVAALPTTDASAAAATKTLALQVEQLGATVVSGSGGAVHGGPWEGTYKDNTEWDVSNDGFYLNGKRFKMSSDKDGNINATWTVGTTTTPIFGIGPGVWEKYTKDNLDLNEPPQRHDVYAYTYGLWVEDDVRVKFPMTYGLWSAAPGNAKTQVNKEAHSGLLGEKVMWVYKDLSNALNAPIIVNGGRNPPTGGIREICNALYDGWSVHDRIFIDPLIYNGVVAPPGGGVFARLDALWNGFAAPGTGVWDTLHGHNTRITALEGNSSNNTGITTWNNFNAETGNQGTLYKFGTGASVRMHQLEVGVESHGQDIQSHTTSINNLQQTSQIQTSLINDHQTRLEAIYGGSHLSWSFPQDLYYFNTKWGLKQSVNANINSLQEQIDGLAGRLIAHGI